MSLRWLATPAENKQITAIMARFGDDDMIIFTPEEVKFFCQIYRRPRAPMTSMGCLPGKFKTDGYPPSMTLEEMKADHQQHVAEMIELYGPDGRRNPDYEDSLADDDGVLHSAAVRELH